MPKLSIITINLNNAEGLAKTIESVLNQSFKDFEYIIIDGASTDNSPQIIASIQDRLAYYVSEPDRNVYHAMNKGTAQASGIYCLYLNSGDCLASATILDELFAFNPTEDIVYCNDYAVHASGEIEKRIYPDLLSFKYLYCTSIAHQSTIIKKNILISCDGYDERYRLIADWEFFFKSIIIKNVIYRHLPLFMTLFDMGGIGTTPKLSEERKAEWRAILYQHVPRVIDDYEALKQESIEFSELKNGSFKFIISLILRLKNLNKRKP